MRGNDEAMMVAGEWMAKAENDLKSAAHLVKIADCPTDAVCFHRGFARLSTTRNRIDSLNTPPSYAIPAIMSRSHWAKPVRRSRSRAASGGKSAACSLKSLHFPMDSHDETLVTVADTVRLAVVLTLPYHGVAIERKIVRFAALPS